MFNEKPRTISVNGVKIPVDPDFRIMCEYSQAMSSKDEDALLDITQRFYFAGISEGVTSSEAVLAINDFYIAGFIPDEKERKKSVKKAAQKKDEVEGEKREPPVFDFAVDEAYFFGAFLSVYGIDLNTVKLHWFDFCALFRALPDDCRLKQIIGIRATDTRKIRSKEEKARIKRLKELYSLDGDSDPTADALREMILKQRKEAEKDAGTSDT